jgi:Methyltransferase domain
MYKIHIDHLGPGEAVRPGQVFEGWTTSPDPSESVAVTVNGRPVGSQSIPRPDIEAALPGRNVKGFRFSFEPDSDATNYNINFAIGDAECAIAFSLGVDDPNVAAETIGHDQDPAISEFHLPRFVTSRPCHQNAIDLFKENGWACRLPVEGIRSGDAPLFDGIDRRPQMAVDVCGNIEGFKILELGPLESGHTYQLERLGAGSILGIEASPEFYLKSLVTKEIFGLKARYLLGDFNRYLEETEERFDLVFASGVLYHMFDPVNTLYLISRVTPRVFIWSHYIPESAAPEGPAVERHGFRCHYFEVFYRSEDSPGRRLSGVKTSCNRLYQKDIIAALRHFGFDKVTVTDDAVGHINGPAVSLVAENTGLI